MNLVSREKAIDVAIDEYNRGYKEGFEAGKSSVSGDGDIISRQMAIDALSNGALINYQAAGHNNGLVKAIDVIKGLPSAQPERKKGEWTIEDCHAATYPYCCSNCTAHHRARYDFCPTCGADMRGDTE